MSDHRRSTRRSSGRHGADGDFTATHGGPPTAGTVVGGGAPAADSHQPP
ncbi:hypothetical protein A2U01_0116704, partial [Trifolium medium]|nr:hypothetical protein [Trifolium medium]